VSAESSAGRRPCASQRRRSSGCPPRAGLCTPSASSADHTSPSPRRSSRRSRSTQLTAPCASGPRGRRRSASGSRPTSTRRAAGPIWRRAPCSSNSTSRSCAWDGTPRLCVHARSTRRSPARHGALPLERSLPFTHPFAPHPPLLPHPHPHPPSASPSLIPHPHLPPPPLTLYRPHLTLTPSASPSLIPHPHLPPTPPDLHLPVHTHAVDGTSDTQRERPRATRDPSPRQAEARHDARHGQQQHQRQRRRWWRRRRRWWGRRWCPAGACGGGGADDDRLQAVRRPLMTTDDLG
jgi:hypothetical protein